MPAHASRSPAPAPSAPPSRACSLRHRPANAGTPAKLSGSPASRPLKLRSVYPGLASERHSIRGSVVACCAASTAPSVRSSAESAQTTTLTSASSRRVGPESADCGLRETVCSQGILVAPQCSKRSVSAPSGVCQHPASRFETHPTAALPSPRLHDVRIAQSPAPGIVAWRPASRRKSRTTSLAAPY